MASLTITIPGEPVAKGRARVTRAGIAYTPAKTAKAENMIGWCAAQAMAGKPLMDGPLQLTAEFIRAVPGSWSEKRRLLALKGKIHPDTRPDADNLFKLLTDGCNKIVYYDDAQIVAATIIKRYGEKPQTIATIGPA